jgi:hypothetical protein
MVTDPELVHTANRPKPTVGRPLAVPSRPTSTPFLCRRRRSAVQSHVRDTRGGPPPGCRDRPH